MQSLLFVSCILRFFSLTDSAPNLILWRRAAQLFDAFSEKRNVLFLFCFLNNFLPFVLASIVRQAFCSYGKPIHWSFNDAIRHKRQMFASSQTMPHLEGGMNFLAGHLLGNLLESGCSIRWTWADVKRSIAKVWKDERVIMTSLRFGCNCGQVWPAAWRKPVQGTRSKEQWHFVWTKAHILVPRLASASARTRLVRLSTNIRSQLLSGCEKRAWNEDIESIGTDLPTVTARFAIDWDILISKEIQYLWICWKTRTTRTEREKRRERKKSGMKKCTPAVLPPVCSSPFP